MTPGEASKDVHSWLARKVSQVLQESADHPGHMTQLLQVAGGTAGNLVTDAQIGALSVTYRGVVHAADRDFLRFPDVRVRFPLDEG
jgi:hypothetical protein